MYSSSWIPVKWSYVTSKELTYIIFSDPWYEAIIIIGLEYVSDWEYAKGLYLYAYLPQDKILDPPLGDEGHTDL